jgi:hypothetical protein
MAFTPDACRSALKTAIGLVPGIVPAQVYEQRRIVRQEAEIKARFGNPINGWQIAFAPANAIRAERQHGFRGIGVQGGGQVDTTFRFVVEGYFGLNDAGNSEQAFGDLTWAVVAAVNGYGLLVPGSTMQSACDVEQFGYVTFAGLYVTHFARLAIEFTGRTQ